MKKITFIIAVAIGLLLFTSFPAAAGQINDAINRAGGDLVTDQQTNGSWGEQGFTGEAVTGLAHVYQLTGTSAYKTTAQAGGSYILNDAGYNSSTGSYTYGPYGGGAYALTRLSETSGNPASNTWRTALGDFYNQVSASSGGTSGYISNWEGQEDSSAVYDIARHTVAASYVGVDQSTWRSGLVSALADLDDTDESPVMGLGSAVWGLSLTGTMGSTVVSNDSGSHFQNVTLNQLPDMLAGHQAEDGSFNTRFDHSFGSGYTETTAMAALGLLAADGTMSGVDYDELISDSRLALAGGVDPAGKVYWQIGDSTELQGYFLAGETLEAIPEPATMSMMGIGMLLLTGLKRRNRG